MDRPTPVNRQKSSVATVREDWRLGWTSLDNSFMPRQLPPLDPQIPVHTLAARLRRLRDGATRRPYDPRDASASPGKRTMPLRVDEVSTRFGVSRASVYAALWFKASLRGDVDRHGSGLVAQR